MTGAGLGAIGKWMVDASRRIPSAKAAALGLDHLRKRAGERSAKVGPMSPTSNSATGATEVEAGTSAESQTGRHLETTVAELRAALLAKDAELDRLRAALKTNAQEAALEGGPSRLFRSLSSGLTPKRGMSSGQKEGDLIVTTSDPMLALQAAKPGQSHRMSAENTSGRVIQRTSSGAVESGGGGGGGGQLLSTSPVAAGTTVTTTGGLFEGGARRLFRSLSSGLAPKGGVFTSMSSGQKEGDLIVTTSDPMLALQAAKPGQSHRMSAENTSGRVIQRTSSGAVESAGGGGGGEGGVEYDGKARAPPQNLPPQNLPHTQPFEVDDRAAASSTSGRFVRVQSLP